MKNRISLAAALCLLLMTAPALVEGSYPAQFLGVCQKCGHDLIALYRPVECLDGRVEWQWVDEKHQHCRPAYKGKEKFDFFNSHLMNPANPKRKSQRSTQEQVSCCE